MLVKEAKAITGGLSSPGKMPGKAYNLPAFACQSGSRLSLEKGTVCQKCYASKGRYRFQSVKDSLKKRLGSIYDERWEDAMVCLIKRTYKFFRWHDSGDIQSMEHLEKICRIAERLPDHNFWLPTMEITYICQLVEQRNIPANLTIRISSPFIGKVHKLPEKLQQCQAVKQSVVGSEEGWQCPADNQGHKCRNCRACWSRKVDLVSYQET